MKITDVAVAVFIQADGSFLLSSRPEGKPYAGYWEFPGGKIETGESVRAALMRELHEELNVVIDQCTPWFTFMMHYQHATVRLHTWRVTAWHAADARGMMGMEGQAFCWQRLDDISAAPVLPGCLPIFRALTLPMVYTITNAAEMGKNAYLQHLSALWGKNAPNSFLDGEFVFQNRRMIQIREKTMPADVLHQFAREVSAIAREHHAIVLVNSDVARANTIDIAADGVHLTSVQLQQLNSRPACEWVGASAHNRADIVRAAELKCDFVVLGSVQATATHPGQAPLGWEQFAELASDAPLPVYAIGGMTPALLGTAVQHGAHGIAMQRAAR